VRHIDLICMPQMVITAAACQGGYARFDRRMGGHLM
jgi:hypothetical protein